MGGLPLGTGGLSGGSAAAPGDLGDDGDLRLREAARRAERRVLVEALRRSGNVRSQAARLLGIDPRNLSYYLRKHGLGEPPEA
jgi:two-component system response regulator PilR (NtrC family)